MGATSELARYAVKAKFEDLPTEVVEKSKAFALDALGCAIGGYPLNLSRKFLSIASDVGGGRSEATIIGTGEKASAPFAAFANCALTTVLDFNDFYGKRNTLIWPSVVGFPSALASGEKKVISGKEFLNALVVGYEVSSRIADSMSWSSSQLAKIWGESATVFAAAAAAGKVYGANYDEMLSTLGMAGVCAPVSAVGKYIFPGCYPMRDIKQAMPWLCMSGVFAAESAKKGLRMTQSDNILDGKNGFWSMVGADGFDETQLTAGLGEKYNILNGCTKAHPGGAMSHGVIDDVKTIVAEQNVKPNDIVAIDATIYSDLSTSAIVRRNMGIVDAEFSVPYAVAVSLLRGEQGPAWYSEKTLRDPRILHLARKVRVIGKEGVGKFELGIYKSKVEVHTRSGKRYVKQGATPKFCKPDELKAKFAALAQQVIGQQRAQNILKTVETLDKAQNLNRLIRQLHPI